VKLEPLHCIVPRTNFPTVYGSPKMDFWIRRYGLLKIRSVVAPEMKRKSLSEGLGHSKPMIDRPRSPAISHPIVLHPTSSMKIGHIGHMLQSQVSHIGKLTVGRPNGPSFRKIPGSVDVMLKCWGG